jgi:hypothetical protein
MIFDERHRRVGGLIGPHGVRRTRIEEARQPCRRERGRCPLKDAEAQRYDQVRSGSISTEFPRCALME